jgi:hypothetical protein
MRYKIGEKVRVKSKAWFDSMPKTFDGGIRLSTETFTKDMSKFCGKILTIKRVEGDGYTTFEGDPYIWTDEMFDNGLIDYLQVGTKFRIKNIWYIVCKDNSGKLYGMSNINTFCDLSQFNNELTSPKLITEIRTYCYPDKLQDSASGKLIWKRPRFNKGDIIVFYNPTYKNYNIGMMFDSNIVSCMVNTDGKLVNELYSEQTFPIIEFVLADSDQKFMFFDAVMRSGGYLDSDYRWTPFKIGDNVKTFINGCWTSAPISFD